MLPVFIRYHMIVKLWMCLEHRVLSFWVFCLFLLVAVVNWHPRYFYFKSHSHYQIDSSSSTVQMFLCSHWVTVPEYRHFINP